ncbi:conserved protein of unknown function [Ectopseudomonas oleovorans]|uniref:Uncharacterized protein n=1 Tax=Ectopseudomonas oleovorans TaxID=301 RepID=A0A653B9Z9_ECTOL|nr:conserved protein of unknown function [Pseudomonas oleovorans]
MTKPRRLKGRPALLAARIVSFMRGYSAQPGSPACTTRTLRQALPDVPRSSLMAALAALHRRAGMQSRLVPGTGVHEYCLGSQAFTRWRIGSAEDGYACARVETLMTLALHDAGRGTN